MTTVNFYRKKEGWYYTTDSVKVMGPFATRSIALTDAADYFAWEPSNQGEHPVVSSISRTDIKPPISEAA